MLVRLILIGLLLALPAVAQEVGSVIEGNAEVVDGDTIKIDGQRIRLFGIDAPEMDTDAGLNAQGFMLGLAQDARTRCRVLDIDRYQRPVAVCHIYVEDRVLDIGAEAIRFGAAIPYRKYLKGSLLEGSYLLLEHEARRHCAGRWDERTECR